MTSAEEEAVLQASGRPGGDALRMPPTDAASKSSSGPAVLRRAIAALDAHLSQQNGVAPFSEDPRCILRVAIVPSPARVRLSDGAVIEAAEPIADVHCWNERIPPMPKGGADLVWAQQASARLRYSLRLLARAMCDDPGLRQVKACRAKVNFVGLGGSNTSVTRIIYRLGYEDVDEGRGTVRTRVHDALENILIGALVWTHNPEALRREKLMRERRPVWCSRAKMLGLYAPDA